MWGSGYSTRHNRGGKRYDNDMVAHVWAAGTESAGQSGNGNFFFSGRTLYSYGSHFIVGYRLDDKTVILNPESYSPSTGRHQSIASGATRHMNRISMPLDQNRVYAFDRLLDDKSAAARKRFQVEAATWIEAADGPDLDDATRLLALVYPASRDPAGRAARLIDKRHRNAERRAAERKAAERKRDLTAASRVVANAERNSADMNNAIRYELERASKRLHRLHRVAKSAGRTRQAATLWRLYSQSRDLILTADERERARQIRAGMKSRIHRFRAAVGRHAAGTATSADYRDIMDTADGLMASGHLNYAAFQSVTAARLEAAGHYERLVAIEAAERVEREREPRAEWLAGRGTYWRGSDAAGMAYIRARNVERDSDGRIVAGDLETSHGASVPLTHAIRAFPAIRRCHDKSATWTRNGQSIRVGHFQIDAIHADGSFTAGCHRIGWHEVERLARELGVFDSAVVEAAD